MIRWFYYHALALLDLVRLRATTQHHVIIVAGICLPILLLLGLKEGHVTELRKALLTSPTGRQVLFWSAQGGELMDAASIRSLEGIPGVELIIPDTQRLVELAAPRPMGKDSDTTRRTVTLYATRSDDPVLRQVGADVLLPGELAVVLREATARALGVHRGDKLVLTVKRARGGGGDSASIEVRLKGLLLGGDQEGEVGYADSSLIDLIEQYVRGYRVAEFRWPALAAPVRDGYASYLVACERQGDMTDDDRAVLAERGLTITSLPDDEWEVWKRLLKPDSVDELRLYAVYSPMSRQDPRSRLTLAPSELAELTQADDVVVAWNAPLVQTVADQECLVVGLSLPGHTWLREHLALSDLAFDFEAEPFSARPLRPISTAESEHVPMVVDERQIIELQLTRPPPVACDVASADATGIDSDGAPVELAKPPLVVVPATLLAYLDAYHSGRAQFDGQLQMFVPVPEPPIYDKARLYARTIDDVPGVAADLSSRGFAVLSEGGRIAEIHSQDQSLQILVWVVGAGVFLFGVVTVVSVLQESTDRKRGTIGILRVMGVSQFGVFYLVVLRACAIGVLAGLVSVVCGHAIAFVLGWSPQPRPQWLDWKPEVTVLLVSRDIALVFAGALACSVLGAVIPAWRASRLDPFEAIVEGRFR